MPTATGSLTYGDLRLRLAERVEAIAQASDGTNAAETEQPAADRLDRAMIDGQRDFFARRDWNFAQTSLELVLDAEGDGPRNVGLDPTLYALPDWVRSVPRGRASWRQPETNGAGGTALEQRHPEEVASRAYTCPQSTGAPVMFCVEWSPEQRRGAGTRGAMVLRVWPKPDRAYRVRLRVKIGAAPKFADDQAPPWPDAFDSAVIAAMVLSYRKADFDPADAGQARALQDARAEAEEQLRRAEKSDDEDFLAPQILGDGAMDVRLWMDVYNTDGTLLVSAPAVLSR